MNNDHIRGCFTIPITLCHGKVSDQGYVISTNATTTTNIQALRGSEHTRKQVKNMNNGASKGSRHLKADTGRKEREKQVPPHAHNG